MTFGPAFRGNALISLCLVSSFAALNALATPAWAQARPSAAAAPVGVNLDKPFTPPADVKIDIAQFGSLPQGTPFYVSPHGAHVAILAHAGSRVQIVYDGAAGPVFDGFTGMPNTPVWFSPDGNHYGYCGFAGNQMTVMVDGKPVSTTSELAVDRFDCTIIFSPNGRHFYYISRVGTTMAGSHVRLVVDGKQQLDVGDMHANNFVFSPDGEHFAAALDGYSPRPAPNSIGVQELVVDGKITNWPASPPVWSTDSQHIFTTRGIAQKLVLYRDGQPLMTNSRVTLAAQPLNPGQTASPASDAPVAIAYDSNGGAGGVLKEQWYLAMNGKQIPGTLIQKAGGQGASQILNVLLSPDGKHYAAIMKDANGKQYIFCDGKRGLDYDGINPAQVQFTSGAHLPVYVAQNAGAQYLVVGGQETAIPNINKVTVSPVGDHVAATGRGGFLDGQPLNLSGNPAATSQITSFSFTPDGNHYAYTLFAKSTVTLYVDGTPDAAHSWIAPAINDKVSVWTQGNNVVYECGSTNPAAGNQVGLCFDGGSTYLGTRPVFGNFTLTPDVKHLLFIGGIAQNAFRLFLDGVPLLEGFPLNGFSGAPGFPPGTWEIEPNGALEILTEDRSANNIVKRYTVTPGASTSLAALMSGAQH